MDPSSTPLLGRVDELRGSLSLVQRPWNPALFDPVQTALRQGIVGEFSPQHCHAVAPRFSLRLALLRLAADCRQWIAGQLALGIEDAEMPRISGDHGAGNGRIRRHGPAGAVSPNSGTLHVFAVAGFDVGLLAAIGWTVLRCTGLRRGRATAVLIPLLFGYAFITGWVPSAARAAFMAAILLAGPLLDRQSRLLNSLGAAALILLACDSLQLFQVGFQLSFGVLAAIGIGARWLSRPVAPLTELDPFLPPALANWQQNLSVNIRRHCASLLTTSAAAWIGSAPLMVHHFHACDAGLGAGEWLAGAAVFPFAAHRCLEPGGGALPDDMDSSLLEPHELAVGAFDDRLPPPLFLRCRAGTFRCRPPV